MNAAVIVLYHPDVDRLIKNLESIYNQVDRIIISDNGNFDKNKIVLNDLVSKYGIVYINNNGNKGIAFALNRAVEYCLNNGIGWLLTLDQDSVCPSNMVKEYCKYINIDVGIISCAVNYNNEELDIDKSNVLTEVNECITSASYVNVDLCLKLGGFDEQMFIDSVDFEYCYRVKKSGYKIYKVNSVILDHELGNLIIKKIGNRIIHIEGHSAFRKYYIAQNIIYCSRKHPDGFSKLYSYSKIIKLMIKTILFEHDKINKMRNIIKGIEKGNRIAILKDNWFDGIFQGEID